MRWKDAKYGDWQVFIDWATRIHDGIYPSRSELPTPKLCGCKQPHPSCVNLAVYHEGQCTVTNHVPRGYLTDCPMRIPDWRPGYKPQVSKTPRAPVQSEHRSAAVRDWMRSALSETAHRGPEELREIAAAFLHDREHRTDMETLEALGKHLFGLYRRDKPWLHGRS